MRKALFALAAAGVLASGAATAATTGHDIGTAFVPVQYGNQASNNKSKTREAHCSILEAKEICNPNAQCRTGYCNEQRTDCPSEGTKMEMTPTIGERYRNPSAKFENQLKLRSSWGLYPIAMR